MKWLFNARPGTKRSVILLSAVGFAAAAVLAFSLLYPSHTRSRGEAPVFLPLTAPAGDAAGAESAATEATITARGDWNYPPFEFLDESGRPSGFNIDILTRIAEIMNLDVRISLGPWHEVRRELEEGEIDVLAGMYRTAERDRRVDFSIPHFIASYGVFVPEDSDIRSVDDIQNRRILVQTGDLGHDYLVENDIGAELVTVDEWDALMPALQEGAADCLVTGMIQGIRLLQEKGYDDIRVLSQPLLQRPYSIAVQEGNAELLATLNEGLNLLKTSGEYDEIHERWFGVYDEFRPIARPVIRVLAGGILALALAMIIVLLWNHSLKRRVRQQTAGLAAAMRELEQANATKDRFLASVSHELRTPLHGIIGMAQLMEKTDLDARQAELLQMMNSASRQLYRILSDLLDTSRMHAGRLSLKTTRFSLDELSSWLEPVLRKAAEEKGLQLRLTVTGDSDAHLQTDRERIAQIIINLTDNAIRNTDAGSVDARIGYTRGPGEESGVLDIQVQDTGCGIAEAEQEEIFSPFTQVSSAPAGRSAGLGLGLSIVKAVTELLGGSVGLSSTPGEGSRFSVRLPVEQAEGGTDGDAPAAATGATPAAGDKSGGPAAADAADADSRHALIAEDEAINRLYLRQLLESRGWTVSAVGNGEEAVDAAATRGFDLILLDLSMPKLGGLEATRELRKLEAETGRRRAPVIALTAHAGEETKRECREAGMDGFVSKPFGERALWAELERVLSLHLAEHATGERHPSE